MAPEQVTGQQVTEQADVYSYGILLFELFTGTKPITAETVERIFYSILNEPLKLEPLQQAGVSEPVINLIASCTQKDPAARPQGFGPVCAELDRMIAELEAPPTIIMEAAPPPPRPAWVIPAIVAAVLAVGAGGYFVSRPKPLPPALSLPSGDMVLVPAGPFQYGEKKASVTLPAFYVDKTEVTNKAYAAFCNETKRPLPEGFAQDKPDYPVVNVSMLDAQEFAKWAGKRLPSGKEWEKAARGSDGRLYPWGNEADASKANIGSKQMRPASDFANGASPSGAVQMVGNAWELIFELTSPNPETLERFKKILNPPPGAEESWYSMRGEGFNLPLDPTVLWDDAKIPARFKGPEIGFRCVKDPQ
jgi:formylglycine-generating enzyme required for sulfatase activity